MTDHPQSTPVRESAASGGRIKRLWRSIPREVRHAVGLATVAQFGSQGSAVTYLICALAYEALRWAVERDMERTRRGLSERYGIELPR